MSTAFTRNATLLAILCVLSVASRDAAATAPFAKEEFATDGPNIASAVTVTVPFTEEFAADGANWRDRAMSPVTWNSTGGPDGGSYASMSTTFTSNIAGDTVVLFRAQDEFNSSGNAFVGDWAGSGVRMVTAYVRHDAAAPLSFFARITPAANFPGAIALQFGPIPSGQWSLLALPVLEDGPNLIFEGGDHASIFGAVGHLQFGAIVPAALAGSATPITFQLDKPSIRDTSIPAVSEWGLAAMTLGLLSLGTVAIRRTCAFRAG